MTKLQQAIEKIENAQYLPPSNSDGWYKLVSEIKELLRSHQDDDICFRERFTEIKKQNADLLATLTKIKNALDEPGGLGNGTIVRMMRDALGMEG